MLNEKDGSRVELRAMRELLRREFRQRLGRDDVEKEIDQELARMRVTLLLEACLG